MENTPMVVRAGRRGTQAANEQQAGGVVGRCCKASNVGRQEAAGCGAQGVCEGERLGAGPGGLARAGRWGGERRAADCSAARTVGFSLHGGAVRSPELRARTLCLLLWDSEAHRALGAAWGWPRHPARGLQLGARSREEDAHGRGAPVVSLSVFPAVAAALGVRGDSGARPEAQREEEAHQPNTHCPWGSQRTRGGVGLDGRGVCGPLWALRSGPDARGPLSAGVAAAE